MIFFFGLLSLEGKLFKELILLLIGLKIILMDSNLNLISFLFWLKNYFNGF